nr:Hypothetical protein [uncultured bacterium]
MQTDLTTLSLEYGEKAGTLLRSLKEVTRERVDYGAFLRAFCVPREVVRTSLEEFDYIFYTYGLRLYGNVPLVEPLEYSDQKRIRDLAIVIDTSASVAGDLVEAFLRKTFTLLQARDTFLDTFNVHLIQCDAEVQRDDKATTLAELDALLESLELKGFGGTDFRPAFTYLEELSRQGEFTELTGVLYFTDGDGLYPKDPPPWQTAFVFLEDSYEDRDVPVWAIKLILEKEEVLS